MNRPLWTVATASSLGGSHRASGAPNQDAVASFETDRGLCVAVADGHGGARYVRSHDGSRLAVAVARQLCGDVLRDDRPLAEAVAGLPRAVVAEWRRQVAGDLAARPLSATEATAVGPDPLLAYGATLLVVLVRDRDAFALQLGDGDVIAAWSDGHVARPVPADARNVGGQTTSLCLADAETSFRATSLDRSGEPPELVLLGSDGYGNSFADPRWPERVMTDVLEQRRRDGVDSVAGQLSRWTAESARVGGDDTTVAVVFRTASPALPAPGAPLPTTEVRANGTPLLRRPAARRTVALLPVVGLVAVAGAVGLLAGWAAGGSASDAVPPTTAIDSASPAIPVSTSPPSSSPTAATSVPTTDAESPASTTPTRPAVVPVPPTTETQPAGTAAGEPLVDGTVLVNAGSAVVEVDVLADPFAPRLLDPRQGGQILDLLTPVGRWSVVDGELRLQRDDVFAPPETVAVSTDENAGWGLAFSAGRVVVVWTEPGEPTLTANVELWDGGSGEPLARTVVRADTPSTDESDNPIPSEQEEGTP